MLRKIIFTVLALSVTSFAAADDVSIATTANSQTVATESSDTVTTDDNMADFLTVVATASAADTPLIAGRGHQRHLGLGFGHGNGRSIGNRSVSVNGANDAGDFVFGSGNTNINPEKELCHGNGHLIVSNGTGHDHGTGHGMGHGNGNVNGHRICTEPSPSD